MQTQTIALIDEDRNILTSISIALEKEGFKVQTYIDGESALIGLTRTPPDLAVIDIKMLFTLICIPMAVNVIKKIATGVGGIELIPILGKTAVTLLLLTLGLALRGRADQSRRRRSISSKRRPGVTTNLPKVILSLT